MMVFIGTGLVIGGLLGGRLSVVALIPASGLAMVVALLAWAAIPGPASWTALDMLGLVVFVQIGYLCRAGLRPLARAIPTAPRSNTKRERIRARAQKPPAVP